MINWTNPPSHENLEKLKQRDQVRWILFLDTLIFFFSVDYLLRQGSELFSQKSSSDLEFLRENEFLCSPLDARESAEY